jgi:hypothetical protein
MAILHERVARAKFPALRDRFLAGEAGSAYRVVEATFPFILLQIHNATGQPAIGLLVDARNYPHRALRIIPYDLAFRKPLQPQDLPAVQDGEGRTHIMGTADGASWFCVPGTDQYHSFYAAEVPWESVRSLPSNDPVEVALACLAHVDRSRLTPRSEPGLSFPYDPTRRPA